MRSSPSPIVIMDTNLHILNKPRNVNRSFRLSEEVISILEKVDGKNINDKMNNLILYCFSYLPELEKKIAWLKDDQQREYQKLLDIEKRVSNVRSLISTLESLERYGQQAERQLKALSEGMEDLGRKPIELDRREISYAPKENIIKKYIGNVSHNNPAASRPEPETCDTEDYEDELDDEDELDNEDYGNDAYDDEDENFDEFSDFR